MLVTTDIMPALLVVLLKVVVFELPRDVFGALSNKRKATNSFAKKAPRRWFSASKINLLRILTGKQHIQRKLKYNRKV